MTTMKTIVWDVDDVLNELTKEWFEREWLIRHPECTHSYAHLSCNPPHEILDISLDSYLSSLDDFRLQHGIHLKPRREVLDWFRKHGNEYRHIALTATPLFFAPYSSHWVMQHFSTWIRAYHFVPSHRKDDSFHTYDNNKSDALQRLPKVDLFIDDSLENIKYAEALLIKTICMPQPWNNAKGNTEQVLEQITKII